MIRIEKLSKSFGRLKVLQNIQLGFEEGECIALIGPNGCGKTTLIKSILGMVLPDGGSIKVGGKDIGLSPDYRNQIGYMPQIGRYPQHMKIGEVLEMIRSLRGNPTRQDMELIDAFDLQAMAHKPMGTLSGGTIQKVSAALAFLFHSPILILDEPTAGLDPLAAEILKDKICKEREKGKLILITSHLLSELEGMVNRILFMEEGQIRLFLSVDEIKSLTGESSISGAIVHLLKHKKG